MGSAKLLIKEMEAENGDAKQFVVFKKGSYRGYAQIPEIDAEAAMEAVTGGEVPADKRLIIGSSREGAGFLIQGTGIRGRQMAVSRIRGTDDLVVSSLSYTDGTCPTFDKPAGG